jgi:hypothetical protein
LVSSWRVSFLSNQRRAPFWLSFSGQNIQHSPRSLLLYTREVSLPCCTSFVARFSTFLFLRGLMGSHIPAWFRHHLLSLHKRSKLLNLLASPNISMQCPAYRTRCMILLEAFLLQHVADPDLINHPCYQWRITTNVKLQYHCSIMKKSKGVNMCTKHIWPFKSAHDIPNYTRVSASKTRARPGIIFRKYMNMMFKIAEKGHLLPCIMEI